MQPKTEIDVDLDNSGRLLAEGWHAYACDNCEGLHIELYDRNERAFAALVVDAENLVPLARALMETAALLAQRGVIELPRLQ